MNHVKIITKNESEGNTKKRWYNKKEHDEMEPTQSSIKEEFSVGSIVVIVGPKLDPEKYENEVDPPDFFDCVRDITNVDQNLNLRCDGDETLVEFVLVGKYVWSDKTKKSTVLKVVKNND